MNVEKLSFNLVFSKTREKNKTNRNILSYFVFRHFLRFVLIYLSSFLFQNFVIRIVLHTRLLAFLFVSTLPASQHWHSMWNEARDARHSQLSWRWMLTLLCIFCVGAWVHSLELHKMFEVPTRSALESTQRQQTPQHQQPYQTPQQQQHQQQQQQQKAQPTAPSNAPHDADDEPELDDLRAPSVEMIDEALRVVDVTLLNLRMRAPQRDAQSFQQTMPFQGNEDVLVERYKQAFSAQRSFVVGVVGTSNAACHDTSVDTCFPTYFARYVCVLFLCVYLCIAMCMCLEKSEFLLYNARMVFIYLFYNKIAHSLFFRQRFATSVFCAWR